LQKLQKSVTNLEYFFKNHSPTELAYVARNLLHYLYLAFQLKHFVQDHIELRSESFVWWWDSLSRLPVPKSHDLISFTFILSGPNSWCS